MHIIFITILVVIVIVIVIVISSTVNETYKDTQINTPISIVGYNNSVVSNSNIDTIYEKEDEKIQKLVYDSNNKNKYYNNDDINTNTQDIKVTDKVKYTLYNKNIDFPLAKIFKQMVNEYLISNKIFSDQVYISGDLFDIYTRDQSD
jgi:hypothetical protein